MATRRHGCTRLLAPIIASLLVLGAVGAELPELLSLVDNTSTDFVIQKISRVGTTPRLTATTHAILPPDPNFFGCRTSDYGAATVLAIAAISSELSLLYSVLRI